MGPAGCLVFGARNAVIGPGVFTLVVDGEVEVGLDGLADVLPEVVVVLFEAVK